MSTIANIVIPLGDIPVKLRCALCNNLARDAYRLPCCEQSICGICQKNLPAVCPICDHSPLKAEDCKINASLRTTVTVFLRTAEKKYGSSTTKAVKSVDEQAKPLVPAAGEEPSISDRPLEKVVPTAPITAHSPSTSSKVVSDTDVAATTEDRPPHDGGHGIVNDVTIQKNTEIATKRDAPTTGSDSSQLPNDSYWNSYQNMAQAPGQNGSYHSYNASWNGYDQATGYGMPANWNTGISGMMNQSNDMNAYNGMQGYANGYGNAMGMNAGSVDYGQGVGFGNAGMGMQGQGNWGSGWNMQSDTNDTNFNSSGMNAGFYSGAGGYSHPSIGNHQSQQNHMMPHHQFQSRGYQHNHSHNHPQQHIRGNGASYGQQNQFVGPRNQRGFNSQMPQQHHGNNDISVMNIFGQAQDASFDSSIVASTAAKHSFSGESSEIVLAGGDEASAQGEEPEHKEIPSSMTSETNDATTTAIATFNLKSDELLRDDAPSFVSDPLHDHDVSANQLQVKNPTFEDNARQIQEDVLTAKQPYKLESMPAPGIVGAPTGPRAMRERGRGRGRGAHFGGSIRGGFIQQQIPVSDNYANENKINPLSRTGSVTSNTGQARHVNDASNKQRTQSQTDAIPTSPAASRQDTRDEYDRSRKRSRSRSRKRKHHRSRSRKRSLSPRGNEISSRDRSRSHSKDRKRHERENDKHRDRTSNKESNRHHRSSYKSSSHRSRRDKSRSRTPDREPARDSMDDTSASKTAHMEQRSKHRDRESGDRKKDTEKKGRKRSRSRHRGHKRSRDNDDDKESKNAPDSDKIQKDSRGSRSSRRHSTRYEDEETPSERERRVEREREEERWGKR